MKKYFILPFLLFILCGGYSQGQADNKIDSLLASLKQQQHDSSGVKTLIALNKRSLALNKTDDAKKYAEQALAMAEKLRFKKGIAEAKNCIGFSIIQAGHYFFKRGNYAEGLKNYLSALRVFEKNQFKEGIATALMYVGHVYK